MSSGESDAIRPQSVDEFWACAIEGCTTEVIPRGERCEAHGGKPALERADDEGWGETEARPTSWWVATSPGDECE